MSRVIYCEECLNQEVCSKNNWCITMDRGIKYKGEWLCDNFEKKEEKFKESKIYKFNDCDTVYIPKEYTLQEAINWYTSEYDCRDNEILSEVDYSDGFWDCDVPKEKAEEIYKDNPSNFDMYDLSKNGKIQEGTIEYRWGDLYIYKTFKTAKEENDELNSDIFVICSTEF